MNRRLLHLMAATALLTLSTAYAQAREWTHLGAKGKDHFLYEKKTTKRQGDIISGWINKQYNVDEAAMKEKKLPLNQYHSTIWSLAYYEFDCKKNMIRAIVGREDLTGKRIDDIAREEYRVVEPKSLDEALLKAICKEIPENKVPAKPEKK